MTSPLVPRPASITAWPGPPWNGQGTPTEVTVAEGLGPEGYRLTVHDSGVRIEAEGSAGFFYGGRTLAQLRYHGTKNGITSVPAQVIEDRPRWAYRGLMLDVCRHWFGVDEVKRLIALQADLKLNVFHWHLTDDQGWRFPVPGYPKLTSGAPAYTAAEIRDVVAFAALHHVTIVPEVDLPGHFSAALAAYPELGCTKKPVDRASGPGIYFDIACAGNDATLKFLETALETLCDLFPGKRIHLGGDEAPKLRWSKCPACQDRIHEQGLEDEEQLQGWLTNRLIGVLRAHGRQAMVWTESVYSGKLDGSALVQHWAEMPDKGRARAWADAGHATIVSDFKHTYLDYPTAMTPLAKSYAPSTWMNRLSDVGRSCVEGIEAALWTEFVADRETVDERLFPRLSAVAERAWSPEGQTDFDDYLRRVPQWSAWFESLGAQVAPLDRANPNPQSLASKMKTIGHLGKFFGNPKVLAGVIQMIVMGGKKRKKEQ